MANSHQNSESSSQELLKLIEQLSMRLVNRQGVLETFAGFSLIAIPPSSAPSADAGPLPDVEAALAQSPERSDLKLLWFSLHVQRGEIPFSALVSTYSELEKATFPEGSEAEGYYRVSAIRFIQGLIERSQLRLAVEPLEALCERASLEHSERLDCYRALDALYRAEVARAELRRESKSYLDSLQERLAALPGKVRSAEDRWRSRAQSTQVPEGTPSRATGASSTDGPAKSGSVLNTRSLLESILHDDVQLSEDESAPGDANTAGNRSTSGRSPSPSSSSGTVEALKEGDHLIGSPAHPISFFPKPGSLQLSRRSFLWLATGVILLLFAWMTFQPSENPEDVRHRLAVSLGHSSRDGASIPLPEPGRAETHDGGSPSIRELARRLASMPVRSPSVPPGPADVGAADPTTSGGVATPDLRGGGEGLASASSDGTLSASPDPVTGVVPTPPRIEEIQGEGSSTVESKQDTPASIDIAAELSPATLEKLPNTEIPQLEKATVDDLGIAPTKQAPRRSAPPAPLLPPPSLSSGRLVVGPDGRTYGPPPAQEMGTGLDGAPVRGVPVDQFPDPQYFRVINTTKVFSAPSIVATPLAELRQEAVIEVVARMGNWLEVQSSGGRRGFIHAQDAVPEPR